MHGAAPLTNLLPVRSKLLKIHSSHPRDKNPLFFASKACWRSYIIYYYSIPYNMKPPPHTPDRPHTHPTSGVRFLFEIKFKITVSRRQISRKSFSRIEKSVFEINDFFQEKIQKIFMLDALGSVYLKLNFSSVRFHLHLKVLLLVRFGFLDSVWT
jgi:hypothetical protein